MRPFRKLFPIILITVSGVTSLFAEPDRSRYIPVREIRTDMEAYCLTVLEGTKIEKFPLKILSIVHNEEPGQDRILVVGTDERFRHAGAVHGCSGSPVYIDGRMAGALSAGWDGSLDPLYLVTPIEDMLKIRQTETISKSLPLRFDAEHFVHPERFQQLYFSALEQSLPRTMMLSPLAISAPAVADSECVEALKRVGLMPVFNAGFAAGASDAGTSENTTIEPGGVLAVPLCMGDINMAAVGTVTEVIDDKVYGFGHSFLGSGGVAMPMSAGTVHTVVTGRQKSFKFATAGPVVGTICQDQAAGIHGIIGPIPPMIPMTVRLDRYDMPEPREFHLQIARDETLTAPIMQAATMSAAQMYGSPPLENSIEYSVKVNIRDRAPVEFSNISSGSGFVPVVSELFSVVALLMNNPYETAEIEDVEVAIEMEPKSREAQIWGIELSDMSVKPGETVEARVTLMTYRQEKYACRVPIEIPSDLPPGKYDVSLFSQGDYMSFVRKASQYRYSPDDMDSMIAMINRILNVPRNHLFAVINLPEGGIALRRQELPNLPASRAALLQDPRRILPVSPVRHWIESRQSLPIVSTGSLNIELTVEQP
jgi:hypothetical protein